MVSVFSKGLLRSDGVITARDFDNDEAETGRNFVIKDCCCRCGLSVVVAGGVTDDAADDAVDDD